mmetsp:Transcript_8541/g.15466  ORF Transcript_8541/g.15466 Transcript_8541/m.15466 type:complete len:151 (-) Transcript_8541:92-544(-)|eukprot:CAMPEP_0182447908 /NCGR_PEP_ID=MMETSP1172-20130603/21604_1 /TAXON_ID=708627 /ORGANISM="Timspurckia oligopyrenoides, Strain CCMP3278" /LENGTH=150 /DNA_ID=CAMNT_0024644551 /DNA_START=57 /DNA_END=509 /DNA_ORIENTATION=+
MESRIGFVGGVGVGKDGLKSVSRSSYVCMCENSDGESVARAPMKSNSAGFKEEFLSSVGVRGPGSRPKFDLRPKSKRPVELQVCDMCKGSGETFCSICEGTVNINVDGTVIPCPKCGGSNKVECGNCRQTGLLPELVKGWENTLNSMFKK